MVNETITLCAICTIFNTLSVIIIWIERMMITSYSVELDPLLLLAIYDAEFYFWEEVPSI